MRKCLSYSQYFNSRFCNKEKPAFNGHIKKLRAMTNTDICHSCEMKSGNAGYEILKEITGTLVLALLTRTKIDIYDDKLVEEIIAKYASFHASIG